MTHNKLLNIISILVVSAFSFINTACATDTLNQSAPVVTPQAPQTSQDTDTITLKVPKNTTYVIAVSHDGQTLSFQGINEKGEVENAKPCAVCTVELSHKYGKFCDKLRDNPKLKMNVLSQTIGNKNADLPFCAGTHKVEFLGVDTHQFVRTRMNPDCISKLESGGRIIWSYPPNCAH